MTEIVRDIIHLPAPRVRVGEIIAEVAAIYGLTAEDLIGPSRLKRIAHPRQHAMWEVRRRSPHLSLPQIGKVMGGRDHTTILYGIRRHEARIARQVAA